jgi:hypothetical protein
MTVHILSGALSLPRGDKKMKLRMKLQKSMSYAPFSILPQPQIA